MGPWVIGRHNPCAVTAQVNVMHPEGVNQERNQAALQTSDLIDAGR
jgi:hypothetical protein